MPPLAEVGKVEAAVPVEHQVVRAAQLRLVASRIQHLDGPGGEVHPLDPAAAVVVGLQDRPQPSLVVGPTETAVVADIALAVGSDRRAIGPTAKPGNDMLGPILLYTQQGAALDLDEQDRSVRHGDRSFGETQPLRDLADIHPQAPSSCDGIIRCARSGSNWRSNMR